MVQTEKPLEHFSYDLASIKGMKSVDVKISNVGAEKTGPFKHLVVTVIVKTDELTLQVPIQVAVNTAMASEVVSPPQVASPLVTQKEPMQLDYSEEDQRELAQLRQKITGRGKITPEHLLFLKKLFRKYPDTSVSQATKLLMNEFAGLQITPSGVRYHLKNLDMISAGSSGKNSPSQQISPKPTNDREEFFDTEETFPGDDSIPGSYHQQEEEVIKEEPKVTQIWPVHGYFLQELYKRYPEMPASQAAEMLCNRFKELDVSTHTVKRYLQEELGIDMSRRVNKKQEPTPEPTPEPAVAETPTSSKPNRGKMQPEHIEFLRQLYKVDPDLPVSEARNLLCNQFDGLDITPSGVRYHVKKLAAQKEATPEHATEEDDEGRRRTRRG